MTLKEKIERERPNQVNLYREGIFWKLYNQSAFHFFQLIKPYQIKKKYNKTLNTEIVSMGFPQSVLTNTLGRLRELSVSIEMGKDDITIILLEEQCGYDEWFQQFPLIEKEKLPHSDKVRCSTIASPPVGTKENETNETAIQMLRNFPIMQKTPLEVQLFVLQLQDFLKQTN